MHILQRDGQRLREEKAELSRKRDEEVASLQGTVKRLTDELVFFALGGPGKDLLHLRTCCIPSFPHS